MNRRVILVYLGFVMIIVGAALLVFMNRPSGPSLEEQVFELSNHKMSLLKMGRVDSHEELFILEPTAVSVFLVSEDLTLEEFQAGLQPVVDQMDIREEDTWFHYFLVFETSPELIGYGVRVRSEMRDVPVQEWGEGDFEAGFFFVPLQNLDLE